MGGALRGSLDETKRGFQEQQNETWSSHADILYCLECISKRILWGNKMPFSKAFCKLNEFPYISFFLRWCLQVNSLWILALSYAVTSAGETHMHINLYTLQFWHMCGLILELCMNSFCSLLVDGNSQMEVRIWAGYFNSFSLGFSGWPSFLRSVLLVGSSLATHVQAVFGTQKENRNTKGVSDLAATS